MKVISFSLYGTAAKYLVGATKNVELAKQFYPGWVCRFYIDHDVPSSILWQLEKQGAQIESGEKRTFPNVQDGGIPPMMWRFLVADDPKVDRFIVRDADSRISAREAAAVQQWIESGLMFHVMRDHPAQARPINGGMWGAHCLQRNYPWVSMEDLIIKNLNSLPPGHDPDQQFLCEIIWPMVKHEVLQHDSGYLWNGRKFRGWQPGACMFPTLREGKRFVGEVFDENDVPRDGDWQMIP